MQLGNYTGNKVSSEGILRFTYPSGLVEFYQALTLRFQACKCLH